MALSIQEFDRLEALRPDWDRLLAGSSGGPNIFSTWDWQLLWWQAFGGDARPRLLAVSADQSLIGIWPLMPLDGSLGLVGGAEVCDYLDIIALAGREEEVLAAGLEHLSRTTGETLDLRFLPARSPTVALLPALAPRYGWAVACEVDDVCPVVDLSGDWDSYLASLTKKDRHELRRKLRRLAEAGELRKEISREEHLAQDVADFLRLHRLSRPEKAAFMDDIMESFFREIVSHFQPLGLLNIHFLALRGERVAATMCLEQGDELWVYNSGFDREYAPYSVGLAAKAYCIEAAIAEGKRRVDFLRGREPYKYDLGARDVPVYRLRLTRA